MCKGDVSDTYKKVSEWVDSLINTKCGLMIYMSFEDDIVERRVRPLGRYGNMPLYNYTIPHCTNNLASHSQLLCKTHVLKGRRR